MRPLPRIARETGLHRRAPKEGLRSRHLAWIRTLPCVACDSDGPCDAAHVRKSDASLKKLNAMGQKPDDKYTVALCARCHRADQHTKEGEGAFWARLGIDALDLSLRLWSVTGNREAGIRAIMRARQSILLHQGMPK